ncbi:Hypothetical protein POVR1_LOCUS501 [uncultured virus]|nr:Hypothetical protein POVR1_LOCUS501 [uncultured virus]
MKLGSTNVKKYFASLPCFNMAKKLEKLEAIQETTSLIGDFSQRFALAARATNDTRGILVANLLPLLTKRFEVVSQDRGIRDVATDYETLLALITRSSGNVYFSGLVGSLTVESYENHHSKCSGRKGRIVEMVGVDYLIQAERDPNNPDNVLAGLIVTKDSYLAVEIKEKFLLHSVVMVAEYRANFPPQFEPPLGAKGPRLLTHL